MVFEKNVFAGELQRGENDETNHKTLTDNNAFSAYVRYDITGSC